MNGKSVLILDLNLDWLSNGALSMLCAIQPDGETLSADLHTKLSTPDEDVVDADPIEVEREWIDDDGEFLRADAADIFDDEVVDPGVLIIIDAAVHTRLP